MRGLVIAAVLAGCAPRLDGAEVAGLVRASPQGALGELQAEYLQMVGSARIVGLGFPMAGAQQVPGLLEGGLFEVLVVQRGFSGLALDADATAARALDEYVGGAAVDVDAALAGLGEPAYATAELRATLAWMRAYNETPGPAARRRLRVFGLDPVDPEAATAVVLAYLERVDPAYVPEARSLLRGDQLAIERVLARLDERREAYGGAAAGWVDARQQAEVTAQARRMAETWEFEAREFARARNAEWALAQLDGGRLMIFADNRRVAAEVRGAAPSMGNFLRQWLVAEYRPIAASYAGGRVRGEGCGVVPVVAAPGSVEAALASSGAFALVDLRGRQGALARPQRLHGETLRPAVAFDAIWTIGQVTPATPLGGRCTRSE
jgi:erythromycin esterase-like protein